MINGWTRTGNSTYAKTLGGKVHTALVEREIRGFRVKIICDGTLMHEIDELTMDQVRTELASYDQNPPIRSQGTTEIYL